VFAGQNNGILIGYLTLNALLINLFLLCLSVLGVPSAFVGHVAAQLELGLVLELPFLAPWTLA
jgi:hypothetical protein